MAVARGLDEAAPAGTGLGPLRGRGRRRSEDSLQGGFGFESLSFEAVPLAEQLADFSLDMFHILVLQRGPFDPEVEAAALKRCVTGDAVDLGKAVQSSGGGAFVEGGFEQTPES